MRASWLSLVLLAALTVPAVAGSNPPEIYPFEQVRAGQKGYGLTTRSGSKPFRFEFEIIGINKNFLPQMDIILVKSDDPQMQLSGFWQGMSGSPLFLDGKLLCAFSYGFRFNKSAIGGCTPLHYMKGDAARMRRRHTEAAVPPGSKAKAVGSTGPSSPGPMASWKEWTELAPQRTAESSLYAMSPPRQPWLLRAPLPAARKVGAAASPDGGGMVASAVPLALSGMSGATFAEMEKVLDGFPIQPMRAGGAGRPGEGPEQFELGAPIGVQLLRGDMAGTGTCTVSYVDHDQVLACGHPMFEAGEMYAPVSSSEVHTILPSQMSSFVIASPLRELGALTQDRQAMIAADTGLRTRMVPVDVDVAWTGKESAQFHVEVIDNRFFTGTFAGIAAMSAISRYLPDRDMATVLMESTVYVRGKKPLHFVDHLYADDGARSVIGGARGLRVLVPLLGNPFAPVTIDRVEVKARLDFGTNFGEIESLRLPTTELTPGERTFIEVHMTTYDGSRIVERVPFDVPATLKGSIIRLTVTAGDAAGVDAAPPQNLDELLAAYRKLLPGNVYAVVVQTADEGAAVDGKLIRDLPASAADKLYPSATTGRAEPYKVVSRQTYPSKRVLNGSQSILIKIAEE
ncbi:MAG TPA: hypothetical protein VL172_08600 [Kofleriaceae bacterium]|jgi:hypothetical protein|nr:hypothetical protein [Kofleriaceae bacterium]